jgi:hypothetical protein
MKALAVALLALACTVSAGSQEKPRPFKTVEIAPISPDASKCGSKWNLGFPRGLNGWMDDDHVVSSRDYYCPDRSSHYKNATAIFIVDMNGVSNSVVTYNAYEIRVSSRNTLLVEHSEGLKVSNGALVAPPATVDILDGSLRTQQTLPCPKGEGYCRIVVPDQPDAKADFALCFDTPQVFDCDLYRGNPASKVSEIRTVDPPIGSALGPFPITVLPGKPLGLRFDPKAWKVTQSDFWYFNEQSVLMRRDSSGSISPVSKEKWVPNLSSCDGQLSASEPRRFFGFCSGAHFYTDGDLDAIFGFSRIAVFDVESREMLLRIDGPAYTTALMSPSGKTVAVAHGNTIRLYRVN